MRLRFEKCMQSRVFKNPTQIINDNFVKIDSYIKRIEEKLSYPIFDRSTNPLTLTEAGKEYIRYALEIKEKEKEFEKYIYESFSERLSFF